ncbi:MAG TPA: 2-oxoglutarate dehydrogenase E1 component, partial [Gammaproteobacteria bacterium]|nr:2-oxoglutarate dehydrogenase E1 component [Gammaproteobacteria bacterium]
MKSLEQRHDSTPLYGGSAPYVETLYERWLADTRSVAAEWREYFERFGERGDRARAPVEAELAARAHARRGAASADGDGGAGQRLLDAWRLLGHLTADIDPLKLREIPRIDELEPGAQGLSGGDLATAVATDWAGRRDRRPLGELLEAARKVYGGHTAIEFTHVSDADEWHWLAEHIEGGEGSAALTDEERRRVLAELTAAEGLEKYLHRRFVGQKRFSLEGGETLIPMLNDLFRRAGGDGVKEIVIGMAHRGRLNVLVNILGKPPQDIFSEFEGSVAESERAASGDVKYHLGQSDDVETAGGPMHLVLAFNPSHLEAVDPVVEGSVRARQDRAGDEAGAQVLPVLIHGDASIAGQGVVMETLQMSQTRGFGTGGTVHIVLNNQIGFTISDLADARSSCYCTDIAKMLEAPVLHVNGDDPEAALAALRLAFAYRQRFHKDAFVDLVCYRRLGHNEADEPAVTQPRMYAAIRSHSTTRELYARKLEESKVIADGAADELADRYNDGLDAGRVIEEAALKRVEGEFVQTSWHEFEGQSWDQNVDTGIAPGRLRELGDKLFSVPEGFTLHGRTERVVSERRKMLAGEVPVDWGCAENLAYATLVTAGHPVRLTGQDTVRGTFFHRHASYFDSETGDAWTPLNHLAEDQAPFMVYDSLLSEAAVVGFEYGYATARPRALVLWEAQYGDFANNAQVMIDQFISSGEAKWGRLCGLVLLLPHGYEGAGPEHSSARLERYLQLCAGSNMQV